MEKMEILSSIAADTGILKKMESDLLLGLSFCSAKYSSCRLETDFLF